MENAESSQVADMTSGEWTIEVWTYDKATPLLIVQSPNVAIASFNWDAGIQNPFCPTEAQARRAAKLLVHAREAIELLKRFAQDSGGETVRAFLEKVKA